MSGQARAHRDYVAKDLLSLLNRRVQFEWLFAPERPVPPDQNWLRVGARQVRLCFVHNRRARRYILPLRRGGAPGVPIPGGVSRAEASRFAERNVAWLEQQLLQQALRPRRPETWSAGTEIFFRGEGVRVELDGNGEAGWARFGSEAVPIADATGDLRPAIERHLWRLAVRELPARVLELAAPHRLPVQ